MYFLFFYIFPYAELNEYVEGCNAIVSCLGHNMSFQGIFGKPRKLVTDATKRLCSAINEGEPKKYFIPFS